ncbi:MAG: type VI secretion system contractile sheath large subunit [Phycisphaerales bacterium]|jgi:type VI secretion system protein ImpC|nr:type VI secretion system contractile sheath large subunit [Phycisphaerales bacterium]
MAENAAQSQSALPAVEFQGGDLSSLLKKEFKPKTSDAQQNIERAVNTLAGLALEQASLISDDAVKTIEAMIAAIDRKLTEQVNQILHHAEFRQLEGSWRGLAHLVKNTETDETLKIRVLNISKKELSKTFAKYKGVAWDQSPLFKKMYEEEFGSPGGAPYGALVGDYYFDHTPPDVEILQGIAQIAAAAHTPFISGTAPSLLNMDSWQQLSDPRDLTKIFQSAEYAPWRSLRDSDDARYLGLCMPRFLSRIPYGSKTNPVDEFAFEEDTEGADHNKYVWANAAYAMAANVTRSFKLYGWCARIRGTESGGMIEGLPCHTFPTDDGGVDMKCPTEISITDRREAELAKNGLIPLSHYKNTDYAVFMGAQSLHKPAEYEDPDATANANLGARLPYLFATCRFAHFLKCMVRDKIGSFKERADMEKWLNNWIANYVCIDPNASEETKARLPLAAAEVQVMEVPGNPGYYTSKFFLRPHYQLEGLTVSLRLVSKLPSLKKG